jgi:hypothetical protein
MIIDYLVSLLQSWPHVNILLAIVGFLRVVIKPIMTGLKELAKTTATKADDQLLNEIEGSKFYHWLLYILDWFTSIKLGRG